MPTTGWEELRGRYRGLLGVTFGRNLGLRDGNMLIAAVFEFLDEDAIRTFDTHEHNKEVRPEVLPFFEQVERCRLRL